MRQFLTTLSLVWIAACIGAYVYSQQQHISAAVALAVVPAFLVELGFYLVPGFASVRKGFNALGSKPLRAALLTVSGVIPYLMEASRTRTFRLTAFAELLGFVLLAAFWYVWVRRSMLADCLFLAFMAAVYLSKQFIHIYRQPAPHVVLAILGQLMWIRLGLMAVLSLRSLDDERFGFLPTAEEWRIGAQHFFFFLPIGAALVYLVRLGEFHPRPLPWWEFGIFLVLTFWGMLWVVSLAEEFFFRAFLQRVISRGTHSETVGLLAAAVLFGLVHLPLRKFPNWRFAIVAGALGIFCGLSLLRARSVRASMVTHALVATTWRMFFSG
ncbi:MAG: CPBP family intramembrane glutamic endopeptidase [Bryobacteraceae bacterium]